MSTISDILETDLVQSTDDIQIDRIFHITDLPNVSPTARHQEALFESGIPAMFEPHPVIQGIIVLNRRVTIDQPNQARVTCSYGISQNSDTDEPSESPDRARISLGSTVQQATTQKDNDGDQITVSITKEVEDDQGNITEQTLEQPAEVDLLRPETVIEFERREPSSPLVKSTNFAGTVNQTAIGIFGARTLLCNSIEGRTDDNSTSFNVLYRFQFKPDNWDAEVAFIDNETDRIDEQVTFQPSNGVAIHKVYPETDFRDLNLPF